MTIKVVVERGEDVFFVAHCPSLKSCWSQGQARDEALANIREAIGLYLECDTDEVVQTADRQVVELAR